MCLGMFFIHCTENSVLSLTISSTKKLPCIFYLTMFSIPFSLSFFSGIPGLGFFFCLLNYVSFLASFYFLFNFLPLSPRVSIKFFLAVFWYPQGQCLGQFPWKQYHRGYQGHWHGEGNRH